MRQDERKGTALSTGDVDAAGLKLTREAGPHIKKGGER